MISTRLVIEGKETCVRLHELSNEFWKQTLRSGDWLGTKNMVGVYTNTNRIQPNKAMKDNLYCHHHGWCDDIKALLRYHTIWP